MLRRFSIYILCGKIVDRQDMKCNFKQILYFLFLNQITGTNMGAVSDIEFFKIAKGIGGTSDKLMSLGILLGFSFPQVRDFLATNKTDFASFVGTLKNALQLERKHTEGTATGTFEESSSRSPIGWDCRVHFRSTQRR